MTLLNGVPDLMLVAVISWCFQSRVKNGWIWAIIAGIIFGTVSTIQYYVPMATYLIMVGIIKIIKGRIWQLPILTILVITLIGTFIEHVFFLIALYFSGVVLPLGQALQEVVIPSMLLNLVFSFPLYWIMRDLSSWVYPSEVDNE